MPSTASQVHQHIEGDIVIRNALGRKILSLRGASRWLIKTYGWEVSEEAVVSALRRYKVQTSRASIADGLRALQDADVGLRMNLALLVTPRNDTTQQRIWGACSQVRAKPPAGVFPAAETVSYLIHQGDVSLLKEKCRPTDIDDVKQPVTRIHVALPGEDPASGVALDILLNRIGEQGVPLLGVFSALGECSFLVRNKHARKVRDILLDLRETRLPEMSTHD